MNDDRYHRNSHVTVTNSNGGIPSVTNVTHPFRGVTDVTVPDLPKSVTRGSVSTVRKQGPTSQIQLADTGGFLTADNGVPTRIVAVDGGHFLMVENGGAAHV